MCSFNKSHFQCVPIDFERSEKTSGRNNMESGNHESLTLSHRGARVRNWSWWKGQDTSSPHPAPPHPTPRRLFMVQVHTEAVIIPRFAFKHWCLINTCDLNNYILVSRGYGKALSLMFTIPEMSKIETRDDFCCHGW